MQSLPPSRSLRAYNFLLLAVAGFGGLLYGVDVGIIAGALPYLEATAGLTAGQLSFVVAAVLLGSVLSTLFAGMFADFLGRRMLMTLSGLLFVASIPIIALAEGYTPLVAGRLLQGISAGLIGVVVPLYLAECLSAEHRGKGTGIFQWLLTFGIVAAAVTGMVFSFRLQGVEQGGDAQAVFAFKDAAWRGIFWVALLPGLLFVCGTFFVKESPRWLAMKGRWEDALSSLLRSREPAQAEREISEMRETLASEKSAPSAQGKQKKESLLRKKYILPFALACLILGFNQATGINSIIGYNATILLQAGLDDLQAHWGYLFLTTVNFLMTIGGVLLVDRKGRKFLLLLGTAGIVVSLAAVAGLFWQTEKFRIDAREEIQLLVSQNQTADIHFDEAMKTCLQKASGGKLGGALAQQPATLTVIYSYGDYRASTRPVRSDEKTSAPLQIKRSDAVPENAVTGFFANPFGDLEAARSAPLKIDHALLSPLPGVSTGWSTAAILCVFMAFFAVGPGICAWLALSELMPNRIRSNGMSVALLVNQAVSTGIAATFLPTVGQHGYSAMFVVFAACTALYFLVVLLFLPETKGKTLEEIEACFSGKK